MKLAEVYENLCARDHRSPYFDDVFYEPGEERPAPRSNCSCDNCFYGRDKLAIEILMLKGVYR